MASRRCCLVEAPLAIALIVALVAPAAAISHAPAAEWALVRYHGPISVEEQAFLRSVAPVLDFSPPFGYVALVSRPARDALLARDAVASVGEIASVTKAAIDVEGATRVRILLYPDADASRLSAHLLREGAQAATRPRAPDAILDVDLGSAPLAHLLAHPEVRWVEPLRDAIELDNARASGLVQSGDADAWPIHAAGVNGSSQLAAVCDTGLDTDAPQGLVVGRARHELFADAAPLVQQVPSAFHRKVALYYAPVDESGVAGDLDDANGHGTHVAGTLAGDAGLLAARDGHDGVAFAARLVVCDIARGVNPSPALVNYTPYWEPAYEAGARVHSNSWGKAPSSDYTLVARQHDWYAWTHRDFLIVRSMGNGGAEGSMRAEAVAKNVLAIGASTSDAPETVAGFSGRGPTADGRVKPDLVAPGDCVTSADIFGPTSYVCLSGTSMATPAAAGAATLVRDLYAKGQGPSNAPHAASSALVRATMVASADALAVSAPDGAEGWGRPRLARALDGLLLAEDEGVALRTGDLWSTNVEVPAGSALRLVLAWTDHPAAVGASPALVNDLDLELEGPGGAILRGNADLATPDRANVIERIVATSPAGGNYTVRVAGYHVPMGPQPFALALVVE